MKKFFIAVISLAVVAMLAYGIAYFVLPAQSIVLEEYTHEAKLRCNDAFIVRDETVYYATSSGTVYNSIAEGDRVSANTVISTTFNDSINKDDLKKLRTIDEKIKRLRLESSGSELYTIDESYMENEISEKMNEVANYAQSNSVEEIHEIRTSINNMREGADYSLAAEIAVLQGERNLIEANIPGTRTNTVADRSGIFSSYVDGLESVLSPESVQSYTPSYISSLKAQNSRSYNNASTIIGDPICKVMNNHNWYILGIADKEQKSRFESSGTVAVRFSEISDAKTTGNLIFISEPDENGECVFLIEIPSYMESAFSYRNLDVDIIFKEYSGYKIPTSAIRTGETIETYYVYGMQGSESYRCDCEILFTDTASGYSIVQSTSDAKNKLSAMERLVMDEK